MRCVKAKLSDSCVFNSRSKTGRGAGRSRNVSEASEGPPSKDKEIPTCSLPGMSTFTLAGVGPASTEPSSSDHLTALATADPLPMLDLDDNPFNSAAVSIEGSIPDFWQDNTTSMDTFSLDDFLDQSPALLPDVDKSVFTDNSGIHPQQLELINNIKMLLPIYNTTYPDVQGLVSSPSDIAPFGHPELDMFSEDKTDPLLHFIGVLTEMSSYEGRLSKLSGSMFHDYPIGDAIFLSHRFYDILLDNKATTSTNSASRMSTPTFLLSISCFITLGRIYSAIFDHLREYILQMPELQSTQHYANFAHPSLGADIRLYRGLKLRQLQPICLCSSWDPVKKAVSMLLDTLRSAEGLLGLPADLRIVEPPGTEGQNEQASVADTKDASKIPFADEDCVDLFAHGSLHKTVKRQAVQLRGKIKAAQQLLNEPCKHASDGTRNICSVC
jgi:hypothetical protein